MNEKQFDAVESDLEQRMQSALSAIPPEQIAGIQAVIQVTILGDAPRFYTWTIGDGTCIAQPGTVENPSLIIAATAADFIQILSGKLSPLAAASLGRLQVSGNMQLAMSMVNLFRQRQESFNSTKEEGTGQHGTEERS